MKSLRTTGKATAQGVRAENKRLLLQHISEGRGTVSRADLVRMAGLNTGTVPGVVDHEGLIARAVTMQWNGFDLGGRLAQRIGYPVHLINDSDACALAEVTLSDDTAPSLMALYVGDGVSAGLILSGALIQGDT